MVPLESRIYTSRLLQPQRFRDASRALRAAPPIWEDATLQYASEDSLNLASLSQGTRSHYEKLLHERYWTIGHDQCKGARTNESRTRFLTCTVCCSADRTSGDAFDHVLRLRPHPLLVQGRQASDEALAQYSLDSDLEQRLIPRVLELVRSPEGLRLRLEKLGHHPTRPPLLGLTPHGFLGCHSFDHL